MAIAMMWLAILAAGLFLTAAVVSAAARHPRRRIQIDIVIAAALPVLLVAGAAAYGAAALWREGIRMGLVACAAGWLAFWAAGSAVVAFLGLRYAGGRPHALEWSWRRLLACSGASLGAAVLVFAYLDLAARATITDIRLEAMQTFSELRARHVRPEDGARPLYERAFAQFGPGHFPFGELFYDLTFDVLGDEPKEYMRRHARTLSLISEAARKPSLSELPATPYLVSGTHGTSALKRGVWFQGYSNLVAHRNLANLLMLSAVQKAAAGDRAGAVQAMLDAYTLADHIAMRISILDLVVAIAIESQADATLERLLHNASFGADELLPLMTRRRINTHERAVQAYRVEAAEVLLAVVEVSSGDDGFFRFPRMLQPIYRAFFLEEEARAVREWYFTAALMTGRPYHEAMKRSEHSELLWVETPRGVYGRHIGNHTETIMNTIGHRMATRALADCALAASVFRIERGRYPETLEELVPDLLPVVPTDPFDGRRIRSITEGDGMRIYSVGLNLTDNDGNANRFGLPVQSPDGDIVFCLGEAYQRYRLEPAQEAARSQEERDALRKQELEARRRPAAPSAD